MLFFGAVPKSLSRHNKMARVWKNLLVVHDFYGCFLIKEWREERERKRERRNRELRKRRDRRVE